MSATLLLNLPTTVWRISSQAGVHVCESLHSPQQQRLTCPVLLRQADGESDAERSRAGQ